MFAKVRYNCYFGVLYIQSFFMEQWKDIDGWEGKYQISNLGRFKSFGIKYSKKFPDGYITLGTIDTTGYRVIVMTHTRDFRHQERIHALVAKAFIPKPQSEERLVVNHIDGNQLNNCVENLEWCTHGDNLRHAIKIGLWNKKGTNHPLSKLTEEQVIDMRKMRKEGFLYKEIAAKHGVNRRHAGDVVTGKNWGWLKEGLSN